MQPMPMHPAPAVALPACPAAGEAGVAAAGGDGWWALCSSAVCASTLSMNPDPSQASKKNAATPISFPCSEQNDGERFFARDLMEVEIVMGEPPSLGGHDFRYGFVFTRT